MVQYMGSKNVNTDEFA